MERDPRAAGSGIRPPTAVRAAVPLAPRCSLELGGPAAHLVDATDRGTVLAALDWAAREALPVAVLGGGSNLVVADQGFAGLVLHVATRGVTVASDNERVLVTAAAGEDWDELVAWSVAEGLAGIECLSGVPGTVGGTPVQNVGAYGQEVAETIVAVRCLDRATGREVDLPAARCGFAYRSSRFRRAPGRWVVLSVTFALRRGGPPAVRYPELEAALASRSRPSLAEVRRAVLALREAKSMLLRPADPNRRSVGSFFTNPIVEADRLAAVHARASGEPVDPASPLPAFAVGGGRFKLSAAWLIERSGFPRGTRRGPVGISTRHALALVHHGGGTTADLLALAGEIRAAVEARFGVALEPEPAFLGFPSPPLPDALLL